VAFPTVAATNTSNSAGTTTHAVSLPASISAGDLLIVLLYLFSGSGVPGISTPSGWTSLGTVDDSTDRRLSVFYKIASGSEGASVTVTSDINSSGAHNSYRITGYSGAPEIAIASSVGAPNPPNLAPSWGALDTLWLAIGGDSNDAADMTAPASYTNIIQDFESVSGLNAGSARRALNAGSENPAAFGGTTASGTALSATVAVRPAAVPKSLIERVEAASPVFGYRTRMIAT